MLMLTLCWDAGYAMIWIHAVTCVFRPQAVASAWKLDAYTLLLALWHSCNLFTTWMWLSQHAGPADNCDATVCIDATGEANMHDLTSLLSGAAHCSLGAVSAALPCPGLPEERQLAEARDHRTRHRPDSPSSRSQSESGFHLKKPASMFEETHAVDCRHNDHGQTASGPRP